MGREPGGIGERVGVSADEEVAPVAAVQQADRHAFDVLYRQYRAPIYRYLRARTDTNEDAADLAQQVFLKAFEALPGYQERGLPFGAWLFRIARNAVIDATRGAHPALPLQSLSEGCQPRLPNEPEAYALEVDALARFQQLIAPLDADRRDLLTLRFVAELPTAEIALILGKRDAAVRAQLSRALKTLKEAPHGR